MFRQEGLIPFFQHAHHRAEGWLLDFQEGLEQGQMQPELFEQAVEALLDHMYVEEELLFPKVAEELAGPIADLREEHGRIWELVDEVRNLLGGNSDERGLRERTDRLIHLLAAHSAAEDLGIYPDLVTRLGPDGAGALLAEAERSRAPSGWVCAARRAERRHASGKAEAKK